MTFPILPPNLPTWAYVCIFIATIIACVLIARFTGNHKKTSKTYKNISQSGSNNNQQIGEHVEKVKEND